MPTTPPNLQSLLEEALTQVPALSHHLLEATQDELAAKTTKYFALLESWRRLRGRFTVDFEAALIPLLQAGRRGVDPLQQAASASWSKLDSGSLALVDEHQAQQDVSIAHVIQAVEQHNSVELHQLGNFFAALRGTARARLGENPLRPALFAHALHQALAAMEHDSQRRVLFMQAAAQPMARALQKRIYEPLCARLRAAQLSQLVASHASGMHQRDEQQRHAEARLAQQGTLNTQPATLDGLARRLNEQHEITTTRPSIAGRLIGPGAAGPDMLGRLYDQILADPRLLAPVKALLARLQVAVVRLARGDSNLLRHQDHPAWQLLNRVAAHGMAFERGDDPQLQGFLKFMDSEALLLIDTAAPSAALFEQVLLRVERHLGSIAKERTARSAETLAALEREQQRPQWLQLLREQIAEQIAGSPLGPNLRRFLLTAWADVIVSAMVREGQDSPAAQAQIDLVDRLLDSLSPPRSDIDRLRLRDRLPGLINDLRSGCETIKLAEPKREAFMQELMQLHARLLSGQALQTPPAPPPPPKPLTADELLQQLLSERESQMPEHWAHADVNRGELPTVPVQLDGDSPAAKAAVEDWLNSKLSVGSWYHLFVQSAWLTAQIAWISDGQQFYLFVGQDPEQRHSMTRGALEKLLANGLLTALDDTGIVQRAVESLIQKLDDGV